MYPYSNSCEKSTLKLTKQKKLNSVRDLNITVDIGTFKESITMCLEQKQFLSPTDWMNEWMVNL